VFGQFSGQHQTDGCLNLPRTQSRLFIVRGKFSGFFRNATENVVDKRVHDGHALFGNTSVGVDLLFVPNKSNMDMAVSKRRGYWKETMPMPNH
jgi:hypothetical protein